MSINQYQPTIGASGQVDAPTGRFFFMIASSVNVEVRFYRDGVIEDFANVGAGLYIQRRLPWTKATILGPNGTTLNYFVGDQGTAQDVTDLKLAIASISGTVTTKDLTAATLNDLAPVACPNAAQTAIFAANLARRRIGFSFLTNAAIPPNTVFIRKAGGVNNLQEVQPGTLYQVSGTYGIDIRNDSGGAVSAMLFEEV